ncbi:MAG: GH3 auxin-responsive promoter family protein [Chitinophagaceae bacterium]
MSIKSALAKPYAQWMAGQIQKDALKAVEHQEGILRYLLSRGQITRFGKDHRFDQLTSHYEFSQAVPIRDYEQLKNYIELVRQGESDILWRGKPIYFAKTSGTTSGSKYIPISKESIGEHIKAARNALLMYIAQTGNSSFLNGKMIFLSGSPVLEKQNGIHSGRLSGIVNHHVPSYLTSNRLPSYETNCIEEWEEKVAQIVEETIHQNMTLISGIPPWVQMYFDKLIEKGNKPIAELFPNFSLLVHGGVNFEPYKKKLFTTIGKKIGTIETFPASEGFFAFQDTQDEEGLLLNSNAGMYFEFVPLDEFFSEHPSRIPLSEVKLGVQYALIISSNAGLWAYNIGDTIKFVSLMPYRVVVTGRIKHFISAFGEHVIAEEVEYAMRKVSEQYQVSITEFTVAPFISQDKGKSYHEWLIEFEQAPQDMAAFSLALDHALREKNTYYDDLIRGSILMPLQIRSLPKNSFIHYMKKIGKLGGQNKVPRLSNDRIIANGLI